MGWVFTETCSGFEAGSYLRLIDFLHPSTLGLRVIQKEKKDGVVRGNDIRGADTLHPTLNILRPTPYTQHPTLYAIHPTPQTISSKMGHVRHSLVLERDNRLRAFEAYKLVAGEWGTCSLPEVGEGLDAAPGGASGWVGHHARVVLHFAPHTLTHSPHTLSPSLTFSLSPHTLSHTLSTHCHTLSLHTLGTWRCFRAAGSVTTRASCCIARLGC